MLVHLEYYQCVEKQPAENSTKGITANGLFERLKEEAIHCRRATQRMGLPRSKGFSSTSVLRSLLPFAFCFYLLHIPVGITPGSTYTFTRPRWSILGTRYPGTRSSRVVNQFFDQYVYRVECMNNILFFLWSSCRASAQAGGGEVFKRTFGRVR